MVDRLMRVDFLLIDLSNLSYLVAPCCAFVMNCFYSVVKY